MPGRSFASPADSSPNGLPREFAVTGSYPWVIAA